MSSGGSELTAINTLKYNKSLLQRTSWFAKKKGIHRRTNLNKKDIVLKTYTEAEFAVLERRLRKRYIYNLKVKIGMITLALVLTFFIIWIFY